MFGGVFQNDCVRGRGRRERQQPAFQSVRLLSERAEVTAVEARAEVRELRLVLIEEGLRKIDQKL